MSSPEDMEECPCCKGSGIYKLIDGDDNERDPFDYYEMSKDEIDDCTIQWCKECDGVGYVTSSAKREYYRDFYSDY